SKHNYKFAPSKTSHCDVLEIYLVAYRNKEGRSCSPLLEMALAISHLLLRFWGYAPAGVGGDFAVCGRRPKGSALWTSASCAQLDQLMSAASPPKGFVR
ncbi:MAG: hypothetical protein K2J72_05200, partial [Oscillospiraceae bacterium]|nr:hypothetical protein [Oscillospiraceae bacterium]